MSKILDIWAIHKNEQDLPIALDLIKTNDVIVFENAVVDLEIDGKIIKDKVAGCAIFSEESDVLILILQNSRLTAEDAKKMLDEKGIDYHLVAFERPWAVKTKKKSPDVWFARDSYIVADACNDTLDKGVTDLTYEFDRTKVASLDFKYVDSNEEKSTFAGRVIFTGVITLADKMVLIEGVDEKVIKKHQKDATYILKHKGFTEVKTNNHSV